MLTDLPEIGRVYLLVRHNRSTTSLQRFQRVVEESPVFDPLAGRHGAGFADFLREKIEVVDGDVSQPNLGLAPDVRERLARSVDVIVNSSGLTDFNPDIRDALAMNVRASQYVLEFLSKCAHGSLLHLSTSYVVGFRDGRVIEDLPRNYTPKNVPGYDAMVEWASLEALVREYGGAGGIRESDGRIDARWRRKRNTPRRTCKARRWKIRFARIACGGCGRC